ncbi:hypothetical protein CBL_05867 [Carabus blaptoides fortunei]
MLKFTLLCLFVIQVVSIQAKTMEEVFEDTKPIFKLYHDTLLTYETTLHTAEHDTRVTMDNYLVNAWHEVQQDAMEFSTNIKSESMAIVEELGMTSNMDKIQRCFTDMNIRTSQVENTIVIGADVCHTLGDQNLNVTVENVLKPVYDTLTSMHKSLEFIKTVCKDYSPEQGLICIVSIVYRRWDPQIEEMENVTESTRADLNIAANDVRNSYEMCNKIVEQNLKEDKPILDHFRKCVQEIANNM